jgi:hypothetical protein
LRELKSKLRYNLQPYSCSIVNLVRTQGGWRITGARLETDYFSLVRRDHKRLMVLAHVHALLRRMLAGQERQVALFDALAEGLSFFLRVPDAALAEAELLLVLCILYHLGYVGNMLTLRTLFTEGLWSDEALRFASRDRGTLVRSVNESLRASHL